VNRKRLLILLGALVVLTLLGVAHWERKLRNQVASERAQVLYSEAEKQFELKNYRAALWNYQAIIEIYGKSGSLYIEPSREKEWLCRAYLNDWAPTTGSLDNDVRKIHPDEFQKLRSVLERITPVGEYEPKK
jgi:hypothetical protein